MHISIFGLGYTGCISLGCLAKQGHHIIGVDTDELKVKQINRGLATVIEKGIGVIIQQEHLRGKITATSNFTEAINKTELSIVAVGTPTGPNGHPDLSNIFKVAGQFGEALKEKEDFHIIIIRSTVLPGTIARFAAIIEDGSGKKKNIDFAVVSNPDFLQKGTAVYDYYHPPITLIGSECKPAAAKVASLYRHLPAEVIITEPEVAEMMKYINNAFHSLKIAFANEVGNICSALHIDPHKVMDIFCMDKMLNISSYYLKPGFAYGGPSLPKDLKGLLTIAHDLYLNLPVIESIAKTNQLQIARAVEIIQQTGKKRIAFLGLSFKAGTADLRNSPAVTVIEILLGKGYHIQIYDKNVPLSKPGGTHQEYIDRHMPHLSKLMVNRGEELIDDAEVIVITNGEKEYVDLLMETTSPALIIDMAGMPEPFRNRNNYYGINW